MRHARDLHLSVFFIFWCVDEDFLDDSEIDPAAEMETRAVYARLMEERSNQQREETLICTSKEKLVRNPSVGSSREPHPSAIVAPSSRFAPLF